MHEILVASAATENSAQWAGSDSVVSSITLDVRDLGSWSGTLKVAARALGGQQGGLTTYSAAYLAIVNLETGATVAGSTGITAAGMYRIDIAGVEFRIEHTRVAGSVSVYGALILG